MTFAVPLLTVCLMLVAVLGARSVQRPAEPFVPMAVVYRSELSGERARASADLEAIRTLGFNSVQVPVEWRRSEPARGTYEFEALDETLVLAGQAGLKVALRVDTSPSPDWLLRRYPDGRFVPESNGNATRPGRACLDHPGVRADVVAYVGRAASQAARQSAWHSVDLGSDLPDGFCRCPHTERRFRDWLQSAFGSDPRPASVAMSDRAAFVALQRADHLALLARAASARNGRAATSTARRPSILRNAAAGESPGQDDWLMATAVDQLGTLVPPEIGSPSSAASRLALALDGLRSATRGKGWLMTNSLPATRASDLRLLTWAALSRGARGVTFGEWRGAAADMSRSFVGRDDTITGRARAAGALARVIGRNPALFSPLWPRAANIAIAYDPRRPARGSAAGAPALADVYRAFFERNIQVDLVHLDEIAAGEAGRYSLVFVESPSTLPVAAAVALKAYVAAGGTLISGSNVSISGSRISSSTWESIGEQLVQSAARAGVGPEVRIEGATGPVETRFLESSEVLLLIGLNHAETPQRVTMTFTPDTQEAIWQNMETGAAVNFIAGPGGPVYTYSFGPRDALVLMIRKSVR